MMSTYQSSVFDLRIFLRHIVAEAEEFAICLFHDVGLGNDGNVLVAVVLRIFESSSCQALLVPAVVVTLKSMEMSSLMSTPLLPSAYSPSVFSL